MSLVASFACTLACRAAISFIRSLVASLAVRNLVWYAAQPLLLQYLPHFCLEFTVAFRLKEVVILL